MSVRNSARAFAIAIVALASVTSKVDAQTFRQYRFESASGELVLVINGFLVEHRIHPVVDRVFPFEEAVAAYAYMESGAHMGKIVIAL